MRADVIVCGGQIAPGERCRNVLGQWAAGYVLTRHAGRETLGSPISIKCEECGSVWRPPDDERRRAVSPVGHAEEVLARVS